MVFAWVPQAPNTTRSHRGSMQCFRTCVGTLSCSGNFEVNDVLVGGLSPGLVTSDKVPGHTRAYPGIPGHTGAYCYPGIPGHPDIPGHTEAYSLVLGHTRKDSGTSGIPGKIQAQPRTPIVLLGCPTFSNEKTPNPAPQQIHYISGRQCMTGQFYTHKLENPVGRCPKRV